MITIPKDATPIAMALTLACSIMVLGEKQHQNHPLLNYQSIDLPDMIVNENIFILVVELSLFHITYALRIFQNYEQYPFMLI